MKRGSKEMNNQIQRKLDQLEFPFEESSWDMMDSLLDQAGEQPVTPMWKNSKVIILLALLLASTATVVTLAYQNAGFGRMEQDNGPSTVLQTATGRGVHLALYDEREREGEPNIATAGIVGTFGTETQQQPKVDQPIQVAPRRVTPQRMNNVVAGGTTHKALVAAGTPVNQQLTRPSGELSPSGMEFGSDAVVSSTESSDQATEDLISLKSKSTGRDTDFGNLQDVTGGVVIEKLTQEDLAPDGATVAEDEATKVSKEERRQERANVRELRKKLGNRYQGTKRLDGFSLLPTYYGIRLGTNSVKNTLTGAWNVPWNNFGERIFEGFRLANGLNTGVYFQYALKNNFRLQLDLSITALDYTYAFISLGGQRRIDDERTYSYSFRTEKMTFKDLQVSLQKPLGRKGTIEVGGFIGLVSSRTTLDERLNWTPTAIRPAPRFIYPRPFDRLTFGALIGYERQLWKNLSVTGRYFYGGSDLVNEQFTPLRFHKVRASRFQFGLKFQINKTKNIED